jgi:hypothetical protein
VWRTAFQGSIGRTDMTEVRLWRRRRVKEKKNQQKKCLTAFKYTRSDRSFFFLRVCHISTNHIRAVQIIIEKIFSFPNAYWMALLSFQLLLNHIVPDCSLPTQ